MVPLFLWIYLGLDEPLWAAGLLVLSGITDTVDGWIARKFHQVSNLGKALDPFADKVTQIAVVTCLSIRFPRLWIVSGVLLAKESFALITGLVFRRTKKAVPAAICGELAMAAVYIVPLAITYLDTQTQPLYAFCWCFFGFSAVVMACSSMLIRDFNQFLPAVETDEGEGSAGPNKEGQSARKTLKEMKKLEG